MDNTHLEIERKYLIAKPSTILLSRMEDATVTQITQTYLVSQQGVTRRVRKSVQQQCVSYTYTQRLVESRVEGEGKMARRVLKKIYKNTIIYTYNEKSSNSGISRLENEAEITQQDYTNLLQQADTNLSVITKTRYAIPLDGFIYEIDVYPFWRRYAIMEVELANKDINPPIPHFVSIIKEVSHDKAFSNHSLAQSIPQV